MEKQWWQDALRVIQYNLQIQDTDRMVPEEIAAKACEAGANAVVINAGGIYAWYRSRIPFHHINEYLPAKGNLLEDLIRCCHALGIKVIGRFDFSKTDDVVYLQHPEWFVKDSEGKPVCYGSGRMGSWSLLMSTCINGGYRNEAFAVKVMEEALDCLEIDGIFYNAPHMEECYCENCRRKYRSLYAKELPENKKDWEPDWQTQCLKDNMKLLYRTVKERRKEVPVILYYGTYREDGTGLPENLDLRYETADMVCTEAQDILSAGKKRLPFSWKPTLNMKLGQYAGEAPRPFGIIHSCPGMDWRHTGLPAAEYEFWLSQIPAANGQLWHSLTGFDAVITDKRLLRVMKKVTRRAALSDSLMQEAVSAARTLLLWNAGVSELGFTQGLMDCHIPFDIMDIWHMDLERMKTYKTVILPGGFPTDSAVTDILGKYVEAGGSLYAEKTDAAITQALAGLMGIRPEACTGHDISAAYGVLEPEGEALNQALTETKYIPVKGELLYVSAEKEAVKLMTFIPPFAPPDGVGAPPERAGLPVTHTGIPLLLENRVGKGRVLTGFFELSRLMLEIGLEDQKQLFGNCISYLNGEETEFDGALLPEGIFAYPYRAGEKFLVHLVNGVGSRPLKNTVECHHLEFAVRGWKEEKVSRVFSALEGAPVSWEESGGWIRIRLESLLVWDIIVME